jgi:hypothetical protein
VSTLQTEPLRTTTNDAYSPDNVTTVQMPAFSQQHSLDGSYAFTTINPRILVANGDRDATKIACVVAEVTPWLGSTVEDLLAYLPLLVLILVGVATASAAIFSPWGTWDIFRWTSNYGRDAIQLRLITPGFGDCLQYLQFIVLSGSLTLHYPGFYQPAVSQVSWSALMFNESLVTHGDGFPTVEDGVYVANGTYGLNRMSQLVGMTSEQDMWAGMIVWLLVIVLALTLLVQLGFVVRWLYRLITRTQEEDLRAKNWPFTAGNAVRVVFGYFLLPVISLSMYQLVITKDSPSLSTVVMAAFTIVVLLAFSGWLLLLIVKARPRSWLFDDLPTVLLYGPLYNTYSDNAATFALVPIIVAFVRGIAIGAVQPSGIAQIIILAICEVFMILLLNAFRPFSSPTSMNAYHTIFCSVRLTTLLLMVAFVPSLNTNDRARGWIGYVILLLHGLVLFIGFFLHSLQTGVEVIARLAGAGGEGDTTAMGGFVRAFGVRQLSRRNRKPPKHARESMTSNSTMLVDQEKFGARSRSVSASSNLLLNGRNTRQSMALDSVTGGGHSHSGSGVGTGVGQAYTPTTPGTIGSPFTQGPNASQFGPVAGGAGALAGLKSMEPADPYFRAPRARRQTMENASPVTPQTRDSWHNGEWAKVPTNEQEAIPDAGEGPSVSGRATPLGGLLARDRADSNPDAPKPDYATREVDYYYGVRGPALSHMPTRKLKTGPADPTGPVSSATGWFKGLFGGKTKEQGKGFEVIRSSRMPPQEQEMQEKTPASPEPYLDSPGPNSPPQVIEATRHFELDDEGDAVGGGTRRLPEDEARRSISSDEGEPLGNDGAVYEPAPMLAPILPDIDTGSSIHMPSRAASQVSSRYPSRANTYTRRPNPEEDIPELPRKSSRRNSTAQADDSTSRERDDTRLSVVPASPPDTPQRQSMSRQENWPLGSSSLAPSRLPFGGLSPHASNGQRAAHNRSQSGDSRVSALSSLDNSTEPEGSHTRNSSGEPMGGYTSAFGEDRPSSMGYVQQHRASDNVYIVNPDEQTISGSTAELVDGSRNNSRDPSSESGRSGRAR